MLAEGARLVLGQRLWFGCQHCRLAIAIACYSSGATVYRISSLKNSSDPLLWPFRRRHQKKVVRGFGLASVAAIQHPVIHADILPVGFQLYIVAHS